MTVARLTAALLAPKGSAQPLHGVYEHPMQKPTLTFNLAEPSREPPPSWSANTSRARLASTPVPRATVTTGRFRLSCSIDRDQHRQLRILAARHGRSIQDVLREAIDAHVQAARRDCACMSGNAKACACDLAGD